MMMMKRMNEIVRDIRDNGSADIVINGEQISIGFAGGGFAELTMVGGGYYTVTTRDGRKLPIAKGQLIETL